MHALEEHDEWMFAAFKRFLDCRLMKPQGSMKDVFRGTDRKTTPIKSRKRPESEVQPSPQSIVQPSMKDVFRNTDRHTNPPKERVVQETEETEPLSFELPLPIPQPSMNNLQRDMEITAHSFEHNLESALSVISTSLCLCINQA
jgi:hypothetical protein